MKTKIKLPSFVAFSISCTFCLAALLLCPQSARADGLEFTGAICPTTNVGGACLEIGKSVDEGLFYSGAFMSQSLTDCPTTGACTVLRDPTGNYVGGIWGGPLADPDVQTHAYEDAGALQVSVDGKGPGSPGISYTTASADVGYYLGGLVSVAGGGTAAIQLLDSVTVNGQVAPGQSKGAFRVAAAWGPYDPSTHLIEIANMYSQTWESGYNTTCADINSDVLTCVSLNSVTSVNLPLTVSDGDGLIVYVESNVYTYDAASLSFSDPLTLNLPDGTTYGGGLPVTYYQPNTVPEPATPWLFGSGLLVLAWAWRRAGAPVPGLPEGR